MPPDAGSLTVLRLRPATLDDRRAIFEGLARSDVTPVLLGHPSKDHTPVLSWDAFVADYVEHFFDGSAPEQGRCYVVEVDGAAVGHVSHSEILDGATELDTWMFAERWCGRGYGTAALLLLCETLAGERGVTGFVIRPSGSNGRAVRSYEKAGFRPTALPFDEIVRWFGADDVPDPVHLSRGLIDGDGGVPAPLAPSLITRRPATEPDRERIWEHLCGAYRDVVLRVYGAWNEAAIRSDFDTKWERGGFEVVGAEGQLAGAIWTSDEGDWTRLREVFLGPPFQGRGIGTALVQDEIVRARRAGRPLRLRVLAASAARRLYARLGFTECEQEPGKVWMEIV